jgi:hypothetical protein
MRIRVIQAPDTPSIDGIRVDQFRRGLLYEVGTTLGMVFLAEGWAEPVLDEKPALIIPFADIIADAPDCTTRLTRPRELFPPPLRLAIAADMPIRTRRHRRLRPSATIGA